MKDVNPTLDRYAKLLSRPSISLEQVRDWVHKKEKVHGRFYPLVWLSRVLPRPWN